MLLKQFVLDEYRFLTFRAPGAAIREHRDAYLAFGLILVGLAGVGRYWDSPDAFAWQHLGLGSLVYVPLLALVIWLTVLPLGPRNWSYRNVLLFISLTAPPALLYAIPVEMFFASATAHAINATFLAIVALSRVALLFLFLNRVAGLNRLSIVVAALLPLALIVDGIAFMDLEHVVYQNMVGLRDPEGEGAGAVARLVCSAAAGLTPVLMASYGWMVYNARESAVGLQTR